MDVDLARNKAEMAIKQSANVPYQSVDQAHDPSIRLPSTNHLWKSIIYSTIFLNLPNQSKSRNKKNIKKPCPPMRFWKSDLPGPKHIKTLIKKNNHSINQLFSLAYPWCWRPSSWSFSLFGSPPPRSASLGPHHCSAVLGPLQPGRQSTAKKQFSYQSMNLSDPLTLLYSFPMVLFRRSRHSPSDPDPPIKCSSISIHAINQSPDPLPSHLYPGLLLCILYQALMSFSSFPSFLTDPQLSFLIISHLSPLLITKFM